MASMKPRKVWRTRRDSRAKSSRKRSSSHVIIYLLQTLISGVLAERRCCIANKADDGMGCSLKYQLYKSE